MACCFSTAFAEPECTASSSLRRRSASLPAVVWGSYGASVIRWLSLIHGRDLFECARNRGVGPRMRAGRRYELPLGSVASAEGDASCPGVMAIDTVLPRGVLRDDGAAWLPGPI
nr:hypothetical protein KitaXyl93_29720 [Kitasatospora sp. Xyl93]